MAASRTALRTPSAGPSTQTRSATFSLGGLSKLFRRQATEQSDVVTKDGENLFDEVVNEAKLVPESTLKKVSTFVRPFRPFSARPAYRGRLTFHSPQHKSSTANFKTSKRKLNDLSRLIAGRGVDEGVLQLTVRPHIFIAITPAQIACVFRFPRKSNLPDYSPCSLLHEITLSPKD